MEDMSNRDCELIHKLVQKYGRKAMIRQVWAAPIAPEPYSGYLAPHLEDILAMDKQGIPRDQIANQVVPKLRETAPAYWLGYYQHLTDSELARQIRPTLSYVLARHGRKVPRPQPLRELGSEIVALRNEGWTFSKIGTKFKRSSTQVRVTYFRHLRETNLQQKLAQAGPVTDNTLIRMVPFSARVSNGLVNANIQTVGDLTMTTEAELLRLPNFGRTSLNEVTNFLRAQGKQLGMPFPNRDTELYWRYLQGEYAGTPAKIGTLAKNFGISRTKVEQIVAKEARRRRKLETSQ